MMKHAQFDRSLMLNKNRRREQKVVASAIILRGSHVLIVLRPKDDKSFPEKWELPGGTLEFGESPRQAVVREVKEETGLEIEPRRVVSVEQYLTALPRTDRQTIQITYLVRANSLRDLRLNKKEHLQYAWVKRRDLDGYSLVPIMKKILLDSFVKR
jgi:8-oxo-dGTP diphosphatase